MLTTRSRSVNSKRCGTSASRSLGPISGSASIIAKTWSMTSTNSSSESNSTLPMAQDLRLAAVRRAGDALADAGFGFAVPVVLAAVPAADGLAGALRAVVDRPLVERAAGVRRPAAGLAAAAAPERAGFVAADPAAGLA